MSARCLFLNMPCVVWDVIEFMKQMTSFSCHSCELEAGRRTGSVKLELATFDARLGGRSGQTL